MALIVQSETESHSFDLITSVTGDLHGVLREAARQGPLATDIRSVTSEPFPATPSARYCVLLFDMDGHYRRLFARPISVLLDAEVDGRRLTRDETKAMIVNLLVAGHDTTGSQVRGTMLVALQHRDQLIGIHHDRTRLSNAVAETKRLQPSIRAISRTTMESVDLQGITIPAESMLCQCAAA